MQLGREHKRQGIGNQKNMLILLSVCPDDGRAVVFQIWNSEERHRPSLRAVYCSSLRLSASSPAPEATIMATMAVIMVGVTTRAIASDSFRWGSLTFSVRLPAFLSYLSRCDHRCRKYLSIERQRQTS